MCFQGIGCYMFRVDGTYVVDATMCGNAARFINHSCEVRKIAHVLPRRKQIPPDTQASTSRFLWIKVCIFPNQ